jgi:hypothetical protein
VTRTQLLQKVILLLWAGGNVACEAYEAYECGPEDKGIALEGLLAEGH